MKLTDLAGERRWCAWRTEFRGPQQKPTKVPYGAGGRLFESNNPSTWITLAEAQATGMAVGIALGPLGNGVHSLIGIDYDTCLGADMAPWASGGLKATREGYVEISPSGGGVKQFLLMQTTDYEGMKKLFGFQGDNSKHFKLKSEAAHPPGFEICLSKRFFTVTWEALNPSSVELETFGFAEAHAFVELGIKALLGRDFDPQALPRTVGPRLPALRVTAREGETIENRLRDLAMRRRRFAGLLAYDRDTGELNADAGRSEFGFAIAGELKGAGWSYEDSCEAMLCEAVMPPLVIEWIHEHDERQVARAWERAPVRAGATATAALDAVPLKIVDNEPVVTSNSEWRKMLQETKQHEWRGNINNARLFLLEEPQLRGIFAFNEFSDKIVVRRMPPYEKRWLGEREFKDYDRIGLAAWLQAEGLQISADTAFEAVISIAMEQPFDPVREYLERVGGEWDGTDRLPSWLTDFLGVNASAYTSAVATKSMIGAVARVFKPGCKMDTLTLLEGEQGIYKSSTLRVLFSDAYFVDHMPDIHTKDAAIQLAGHWCVEHAEMDKLSRADASRVKSFITTQVDKYRRPYGRVTEAVPRRCVFWGTMNDSGKGYLTDETGNRRFWPVRCADRKVNLRLLQEQRDQLWGEAVVRYLRGEQWWMSGRAEQEQKQQVEERFDEDVWAPRIRAFLDRSDIAKGVSISEILEGGLAKPRERWTRMDQMRIARTLQADGWVRKQFAFEIAGSEPKEYRREWRYIRGTAKIVPFPDQIRTPTPL